MLIGRRGVGGARFGGVVGTAMFGSGVGAARFGRRVGATTLGRAVGTGRTGAVTGGAMEGNVATPIVGIAVGSTGTVGAPWGGAGTGVSRLTGRGATSLMPGARVHAAAVTMSAQTTSGRMLDFPGPT